MFFFFFENTMGSGKEWSNIIQLKAPYRLSSMVTASCFTPMTGVTSVPTRSAM